MARNKSVHARRHGRKGLQISFNSEEPCSEEQETLQRIHQTGGRNLQNQSQLVYTL